MLKFIRRALAGERADSSRKAGALPPDAFFGGAYRPHAAEDVGRFTALAAAAFPNFSRRITCFGADWLGRQFAEDEERLVGGERQILMLEPGTGEVLELSTSLSNFQTLLIQEPDAVACVSFFRAWIDAGGAVPGYEQCVGYRRPLYLGGEDDVPNLELSDFEVYWHISAQLLDQVRGLPPGSKIGNVTVGH